VFVGDGIAGYLDEGGRVCAITLERSTRLAATNNCASLTRSISSRKRPGRPGSECFRAERISRSSNSFVLYPLTESGAEQNGRYADTR
jgi:hypothetical protein